MKQLTEAEYKILAERFNKMTFLQKLITIKNNENLMFIETDGYNVRLRFVDQEVMKRENDLLFSFPEFFDYSHLKDIFSLSDIKVRELK
ncbi:MAG TPA: hypothetical protein PLH46_06160 [Caldisericia bacterium]|nr:hypothetical protein [Caldisericia bacterium]